MLGFFGTDIHVEAAEVGKKFKNLFMLYSKCHHAINKAERVTDQEIIELSMLKYSSKSICFSVLPCRNHSKGSLGNYQTLLAWFQK